MAIIINQKELDDFCLQLFRTLDVLGLLPLQLWAKPTEFEKYPRMLFSSIQRYGSVEAGFKEWETRILRDAPYRKEDYYLDLEVLRRRMVENADLFNNKANLQHLRTSLYARIFQYLYPRRVLANAYCVKHQGNPKAIEAEFISKELLDSISDVVKKLQVVYSKEWDSIVADSKASLIANAGYYRKMLRSEELVFEKTKTLENQESNISREE